MSKVSYVILCTCTNSRIRSFHFHLPLSCSVSLGTRVCMLTSASPRHCCGKLPRGFRENTVLILVVQAEVSVIFYKFHFIRALHDEVRWRSGVRVRGCFVCVCDGRKTKTDIREFLGLQIYLFYRLFWKQKYNNVSIILYETKIQKHF